MGLYDRGYTQAGSDYGNGGHLARFMRQSMTVKIVVVTVVVYLIDNLFANNAINNTLHLEPDAIKNPLKIWQLLTVGITHAPISRTVWHIAGNMWSLWIFGRFVEQKYGGREFLALYLAMLAGASAIWCICALIGGDPRPAIGASGGIAGIVVIFALSFPHQKLRLIFPPIAMPAWLLGALIVGMDALGAVGAAGRSNVAYTAHLGGALFGAIYFFSRIRLTGGSNQTGYAQSSFGGQGGYGTNPDAWKKGGSGGGWKLPKIMPSLKKAKLKVYDPEKRAAELDQRADAILEKMHKQGADSLTAKERKILDDYSRRVREKR